MKTNDVILFGVGLAVGYFVKSSLDKRNAVATTQVGDENYVFSQKYKDCEQKVSTMALPEGAGIDYRKKAIEKCMNEKGVPASKSEGNPMHLIKATNSQSVCESKWVNEIGKITEFATNEKMNISKDNYVMKCMFPNGF